MSLLLPTASSTQASKSQQQQSYHHHHDTDNDNANSRSYTDGSNTSSGNGGGGACNVSPPPGTPSLLTSAPSSCPSAYDKLNTSSAASSSSTNGPSLLSTPHARMLNPAGGNGSLLLGGRGRNGSSAASSSAASSSAASSAGRSPYSQSPSSQNDRPRSLNDLNNATSHRDQQQRSGTPTPTMLYYPQRTPHMTPMGTPITASLTPEQLHHHRHFIHHQRTQVVAYEHELLHKFILNNTQKIQSISRADHKAMVKILISEAYRNDPNRRANKGRWERIMRDVMREVDSKNSVLMSIAPDPYHGALAKLSSMLLHNNGVQYWSYRYWEEEMLRRRSVQQATLARLRGALFLDTPAVPTTNKFAY